MIPQWPFVACGHSMGGEAPSIARRQVAVGTYLVTTIGPQEKTRRHQETYDVMSAYLKVSALYPENNLMLRHQVSRKIIKDWIQKPAAEERQRR